MEKIITMLKELKEKTERSFINNSLIVLNTKNDSPIPDTKSDLKMIYELNGAISILENSIYPANSTSNNSCSEQWERGI